MRHAAGGGNPARCPPGPGSGRSGAAGSRPRPQGEYIGGGWFTGGAAAAAWAFIAAA